MTTMNGAKSPRANSSFVPVSPGGVQSPRITTYVEMNQADGTNYTVAHVDHTVEEEHRARFLSDAERVIADHPMEARQSFKEIENTDTKQWAKHSIDELVKYLNSNTERGLDAAESEKRLAEYGPNALDNEPPVPIYITFLLQFYNLIIFILLIAAFISFFLGKTTEAIAILFIVNLNAGIATYQESNASSALEALAQLSSPQCVVLRNGEQQVVDSKMLVPGDVVVLTTGDVVPADIRLYESSDLKVNEMLLTGESEDVGKRYNADISKSKKLTPDNMVFSSTTVTAGNARGFVVETGMSTRVGSIAALLQSKGSDDPNKKKSLNPLQPCLEKYQPKLTPLQMALNTLGAIIGSIALTVCGVVFAVGMIRGSRDLKDPDNSVFLNMITASVSLAVSAVPSGLPMVVTICLSVGTAAMIKKNVLVRKIAAVETLGAASVICTDKTGTLTEGKMTAVKMWGDFKTYDITGKGFNPEGGIFMDGVNQVAPGSSNVQVRATLLSGVLCSNTHLKQQEVEGVTTWVPFGNSSEAPLIVAAAKAGIWEDYVADTYSRVGEVPFSSSRKMMVTLNKLPENGMFDSLSLGDKFKYVANVKGAPNYILNNCTRFCQTDGTFVNLTDEHRQQIMDKVDELSSQALRVLAVAIQPLHELPYAEDCDDVDDKFAALSQPLVLMGLMASIDPERDGVKGAILTARRASIRTVMITGDYLKTAVAIAKNIELLEVGALEEEQATDCTRLRPRGDVYLPDHELDEITSKTVVFARAKPEDKIEIVKSLQRQGLVAAMTGDGVNDAPALKEADIGVAMGISGTEVAKGASDMVLLDDNFVSIVGAVERGRVIYANIQKFVIFLLSTNIGEILLLFTTIAAGMPLPLEPLQILILNLFTDGMPGASLSMERGDPNIMDFKPRPKMQPLIHGRLWKLIGYNAIFIVSGVLAVFVIGMYWNFGMFLQEDIIDSGAGWNGKDFTGATCRRWEGFEDGWRLYGNCNAKINGVSIFPHGEERVFAQDEMFENADFVCYGGDYTCVEDGIARARTMAFAAMTMTEVFRAFTIRSFTESMFVGMFTNKHLVAAVTASFLLTFLVTLTPGLMTTIFGFQYITVFQWMVSFLGAFNAVFWSEMMKWVIRCKDRSTSRRQHLEDNFEAVMSELRVVRAQLDRIDKK